MLKKILQALVGNKEIAQENLHANSMHVIKPYRVNGVWVFDDPRVGLVQEPFVSGIPAIIEHVTSGIKNPEEGFTITFSKKKFFGYQIRLAKLRDEYGGASYVETHSKMEGWLCPAMLKYFESPPPAIYVQISK